MLDKKTVAALRHKWDYINPEKNDFLNFEDFLEFAEESGFRDGLVLTRLRPSEEHSRENTRFMHKGLMKETVMQTLFEIMGDVERMYEPELVKVETNLFDKEEIYKNCTVQVLTNTVTGEVSVGWWKNDKEHDR